MYLVNHSDVIIISTNHRTLYPVGSHDQHEINMMKRDNRRQRNTEVVAPWLNVPQSIAS